MPARLAAVARTGLPGAPTSEALDRVARLASRLTGMPVGLVSLVERDRQWFAGNAGMRDAVEAPLSFCSLVVRDDAPLVVADARTDLRLRAAPHLPTLGVVAYCGVPIRDAEGQVLGSLCALGPSPRDWSDEDVAALTDLVASVESELRLRAAVATLEAERHRADAANRAKSEFLTRMSHELRTPLNAIIGFTGVLLREPPAGVAPPDPARQRGWLERVRSNATHLLGIINAILDLARIEAGKMEICPEPVALDALLADALLALEGAAPPGVALRLEVPPSLAPLRADPLLLRQVIVNLVGNALKFTAAGEVTVRLRSSGSRATALEVEDTGIGIPAERQSAIFEPFEQAESLGTRRHYGGTGLGLPMAAALCERMGWRVWLVRSSPGEGSVFRVSF